MKGNERVKDSKGCERALLNSVALVHRVQAYVTLLALKRFRGWVWQGNMNKQINQEREMPKVRDRKAGKEWKLKVEERLGEKEECDAASYAILQSRRKHWFGVSATAFDWFFSYLTLILTLILCFCWWLCTVFPKVHFWGHSYFHLTCSFLATLYVCASSLFITMPMIHSYTKELVSVTWISWIYFTKVCLLSWDGSGCLWTFFS